MNCEVFQEKINDFIFDRIEYSEDLEAINRYNYESLKWIKEVNIL